MARLRMTHRLAEAAAALAGGTFDLLLTGTSAADGDVLEFLSTCLNAQRRVRRVFVVTTHLQPHVLAVLHEMRIDGVFDAGNEGPERFSDALPRVIDGLGYWSPTVLACVNRHRDSCETSGSALTPTERLVFALLGDGIDNGEAAERLNLSPLTIQSVRRALHRKLGARHRGDLVRLASQLGYVRQNLDGVVRPGYSLLHAAWQAQRPRPNDNAVLTGGPPAG